jgi:DNA anti-recombination protein RmuC
MPARRPDRLTTFRDELRADIAASESRLAARIDAVEPRLDTTRDELRAEIAATRELVTRTAEETRRHFDVIAESLRVQMQLVAEGVLTGDRKHERLREDIDDRFRVVDTRLARLDARVFPPADR